MNQLSPDLARKLAQGLRQYKDVSGDGENEDLQTKLASQKEKYEELEKEASALRSVLDGVKSGQIDPDDIDEKVSEFIETGDTEKVASRTSPTQGAVGIGRLDSAAVVDPDADPLTSYLESLGTR